MQLRRIVRRIAQMTVGAVALTGCYSLQPVRGTIEPGKQVAFDITDVGRVALGGSMGPEIGQVEGRLIQRDNGEYLLGVTSVNLLRGGTQTWAGEQVHLKPEYVGNVYERRFDTGRTLVLAAAGAGAIAFLATRDLLGNGNRDVPDNGPDSSATLRRPTRGVKIPLWSVALPRIPFIGRP